MGRCDYRAGGLWRAAHGTGREFSAGACTAAALIRGARAASQRHGGVKDPHHHGGVKDPHHHGGWGR